MTIVLAAIPAVIVGLATLSLTGSPILAIATGSVVTFVWMYLPLPQTNGSMGGSTDRYWGFR